MKWYIKVLKNYANFNGRARCREYWLFELFNFIIWIILELLDTAFFGDNGLLLPVYALAVLVPAIAVTVRRLHDVGKSGWWYFISFIPILGGIWFLYLRLKPGDIGENKYGDDPKGEQQIEL